MDDGRNLSISFLQNSRTGKTVQKGLTLQHPNGRIEVCKDMSFGAKRSWKSPRGIAYSVEWEIKSTEPELAMRIRPRTDDHEIPVLLYGQIWEGPCTVEVRGKQGRKVRGIGFQELIGQAHE